MSSADCHPLDLFAANNLHEENDKTWDILRPADDGSFPPPPNTSYKLHVHK